MARVAQHGESQFILRFPRKLAERVERMMSDQGPHEIAVDMMSASAAAYMPFARSAGSGSRAQVPWSPRAAPPAADQECVVKVGKNQFPGTLGALIAHAPLAAALQAAAADLSRALLQWICPPT